MSTTSANFCYSFNPDAAAPVIEDQNSSPAASGLSSVALIPPHTKQVLLYSKIERRMKAFKGHRCALGFDRGFVHSELKSAK
jgi:hypothetical protein